MTQANKTRSVDEIQDWLCLQISERLGREPNSIDIRTPFTDFGLSSKEAVVLSGDMEEWLGRRLSPTLLFEYPDVEAMARFLGGEPEHPAEAVPAAETRAGGGGPVAVIGIGCRFPGAPGVEAFRELLFTGVDAITEVPADRWSLEEFYHPDAGVPGKMNTRWGGFLQEIDRFDPYFFGISPREAANMDPQQRLLLEVARQALDDGGQVAARLSGSKTGVFIGIATNDYGQARLGRPGFDDIYMSTGNASSIAANRISYLFGFQGPSMAIDTACSSSLLAIHLACRSLNSGESDLALTGGVNIILSPHITINFSKAGFLAPDGRCKTFDARADGYVRGEGVGMVVLKRLSEARRDGDPVYAVIRGSAVNQDGRSNGLTAPNGRAQEAVLSEAYRRAKVSPGQVRYIESHGTGTALGDPIEAKALGAVLADKRSPGHPCRVGSVKTNIGHLEAAAGIAGVIKVALALKHGVIPPSLHYRNPNPHIPFDELQLQVQRQAGPWPDLPGPSLAGVSSFGFGGTNVHVVLEEAPSRPRTGLEQKKENTAKTLLLPLSAHSEEALNELARSYRDYLSQDRFGDAAALYDACYTAALRRDVYDHRLTLTGRSQEEFIERLNAFLQGDTRMNGLSAGCTPPNRKPKPVFVFSGQGSAWPGMGRQLLQQEPVFRSVIERCDREIRRYADWSLLRELEAEEAGSRLGELDVLQPVLFSLQAALTALWRSYGIEPASVTGYSLGEVAAAHAVGALSIESGIRIMCARSKMLNRVKGKGSIAVVELPLPEARQALAGYEERVFIAAGSSPTITVLSGEPEPLQELLEKLQGQGVYCLPQAGEVAVHTKQLAALGADFAEELAGLAHQPATIPLYSTVTGTYNPEQTYDAGHWVKNLKEPVLFSPALQQLFADGYDTFIEIGPHPLHLSSIHEQLHAQRKKGLGVPSLRRKKDEREAILSSLGTLFTLGADVDWSKLYPVRGNCLRFPVYPFQRERCWLDVQVDKHSSAAREAKAPFAREPHPLLGRYMNAAVDKNMHFWEMELGVDTVPFLQDHCVQGAPVVPGAAYVEMARAAAERVAPGGHGPTALIPRPRGGPRHKITGDSQNPLEHTSVSHIIIEKVEFKKALFLPEQGTQKVQLAVLPGKDGNFIFRVYSFQYEADIRHSSWTLHAEGVIRTGHSEALNNRRDGDESTGTGSPEKHAAPEELRKKCPDTVPGRDHYRLMDERGLNYGPTFRGVEQIHRRDGEAVARIILPENAARDAEDYGVHPALLDACFQVLGSTPTGKLAEITAGGTFLPVGLDSFRLFKQPSAETPLWAHALLHKDAGEDETAFAGDVFLLDEQGQVIFAARGLQLQRIDFDVPGRKEEGFRDWLYELRWVGAGPQPIGHAKPLSKSKESSHENKMSKQSTEGVGAGPQPLYPGHVVAHAPRARLIFADKQGTGEQLKKLLQARGETCVMVYAAEKWKTGEAGEYFIDPTRPEDFQRLLKEAFVPGQAPCTGVIYLWSLADHRAHSNVVPGQASPVGLPPAARGAFLENRPPDPPQKLLFTRQFRVATAVDISTIEKDLELCCFSVLHLVKALAYAGRRQAPLLHLVTRGAQAAGPQAGDVSVSQATLWGLGRVIALEHPEFHSTLIDCDPEADREEAALLLREIDSDDHEDQVALRGRDRFVARLEKIPAAPQSESDTPLPLRADSTYLITGGLGGLGLTFARWLAENGAKHIALMGRSEPSPAAQDTLQALEKMGAHPKVVKADVGSEQEVAAALAGIDNTLPPLRGIIHGAGLLDDAILLQSNVESFRKVMAPKVRGTWHLHTLTADKPLDFFVLFSSAASMIGSPGQGNYSAANAFLDALTVRRRFSGLPVLCINWGPWAEVGLAARADRAGQLAARGVISIPPRQGVNALGYLLRSDLSQTGVLPMDWQRYRELHPADGELPLLSRILPAGTGPVKGRDVLEKGKLGGKIRGIDQAGEREKIVTAYLREHVAKALGIPTEKLDTRRPLNTVGIDSLMAVEIKNRIEFDMNIVVSMVQFLKGPTVEQLTAALLKQLGETAAVPETQSVHPGAGFPPAVSPDPAAAPSGDGQVTAEQQPAHKDRFSNEKEYPLSYGQRALWFLNKIAPENAAYNISHAAYIGPQPDAAALGQAFREIVRRHPVLRSTYKEKKGGLLQQVEDGQEPDFRVVAADTFDINRLTVQLREEADKPFDLEQGPVLRVTLFIRAAGKSVLALTVHHIAVDFWSLEIILSEVLALYSAIKAGQQASLPAPPARYRDFVRYQAGMLSGPAGGRLWTYWKTQLQGELPVLNLPTDRPRPKIQTFDGALHHFELDDALSQNLAALAKAEGVTLFTTTLTACFALLYRYTGQDDILVGTPTVGRSRPEFEKIVGYFVNPVVLRAGLEGEPAFHELLRQVQQTLLAALEHQDFPFPLLVEKLQLQRDTGRSPLFQVDFVWEKSRLRAGEIDRDEIEPFLSEQRGAAFDLTFRVFEIGDTIAVTLQYNTDLFDEDTIRRMGGHYRTLLAAFAADPRQAVSQPVMLTGDERRQMLSEWNATGVDIPPDVSLTRMFEDRVDAGPEAEALRYRDNHMSYRELNRRSNRLGHYLRKLGVGPDTLVVICMERSIEMVVGIYGIIKAGGAYVPLDPDYPEERQAFILEDTQTAVLLTRQRLLEQLPRTQEQKAVCLDSDRPEIAKESTANPENRTRAEDIAYAVYTSGSTGRPKGVMNSHRAICNRLIWMQDAYGLTAQDRVMQKTPFSFDVSVWEFFWPLLYGAALVVARPGGHRDSAYLVKLIMEQQITTIHFVPSMLNVFLNEKGLEDCTSLERVICSGEALSFRLRQRFYSRLQAELHNLYGPTEAAVDVTYWACKPEETRQIVPIGKPISNIQIYILDPRLQPVPIGVAGELHIGGIGLARGYTNRPELTNDKFIFLASGGQGGVFRENCPPAPPAKAFINQKFLRSFFQKATPRRAAGGTKLYKTGDLARWLPDGNIEYLGRLDSQVKIRGFRIELGEIETVLTRHPAIREAVVVIREDLADDKRLTGYLVPASQPLPNISKLRDFLREKLPDYMIPAVFVTLDNLPLTANGKVDRRALPAPTAGRPELKTVYAAPRTEAERVIAETWKQVLQVEKVGMNDNFFDLGGHSLLMVQVHNRLRENFKQDLSIMELFRYPTVASMAKFLTRGKSEPAVLQSEERVGKMKEGKDRLKQQLKRKQQAARKRGGK